jgi:hypothetical protein
VIAGSGQLPEGGVQPWLVQPGHGSGGDRGVCDPGGGHRGAAPQERSARPAEPRLCGDRPGHRRRQPRGEARRQHADERLREPHLQVLREQRINAAHGEESCTSSKERGGHGWEERACGQRSMWMIDREERECSMTGGIRKEDQQTEGECP